MSKAQGKKAQADAKTIGEAESASMAIAILSTIQRLADRLIVVGGIVLVVYFGIYRTAVETAGKETIINMAVEWIVGMSLSQYAAWAVSGVTTTWAFNERRLRLDKERLNTRQDDLRSRTKMSSGNAVEGIS